MEKMRFFLVHKGLSLDSMRFATSIGVCKHWLWQVRKATATREKMASISSWVWPTCRWWQEAASHRPAWVIHAIILLPCWFLTSFTVLSDCTHNLKHSGKHHGKIKISSNYFLLGPRNSDGNLPFRALVLAKTPSRARITSFLMSDQNLNLEDHPPCLIMRLIDIDF